MTKKELMEELESFDDDSIILIDVHDTILFNDLYDFSINVIKHTKASFNDNGYNHEYMKYKIRLCPVITNRVIPADKIVVNKEKSKERITDMYKYALKEAKKYANDGYDSFTLQLTGKHEELTIVTNLLKPHGIRVIEKGFDYHGDGKIPFANIKFKIFE